MSFSRFLQAGIIAASTMVAFAGGTTDKPATTQGNILTDMIPGMLKHNTYIGIEGGATFFNDDSFARDYNVLDNHISSTSTNGGAYGAFFGVGNDLMKFEIGIKQFDSISEYDISYDDITATLDTTTCELTINDNRSITISNSQVCAEVANVVGAGLTIDLDGTITTSATYPYLAAKIGTKMRGLDMYIRPGVVFAGNHNLDVDATASFTTAEGVAQSASLGSERNYEVNPTFLGFGLQYPLYESTTFGAEYQVVNKTSSFNLNLTYKLG